jgi:hypothetical protein
VICETGEGQARLLNAGLSNQILKPLATGHQLQLELGLVGLKEFFDGDLAHDPSWHKRGPVGVSPHRSPRQVFLGANAGRPSQALYSQHPAPVLEKPSNGE